ncbi:MAG TPA: amidohydrolase [Victivallales bacterium]|nr:amidohydrolase [Victivallales bacterium]
MHWLLEKAFKYKKWAVDNRHHLHTYPELSHQEKETSEYCKKILIELGYKIKDSWEYGFTADLIISDNFKTIAYRTDMDALPILEKNNNEYISLNEGVSHMCGHDIHMSTALLSAKLLISLKDNLSCNVRFIFQPCEETPPGGAKFMIENGCLDGVSEIYGLHNDPTLEVGKIGISPKKASVAGDLFNLTIKGEGCHAARPDRGLDPIAPAANLMTHWQSSISRRLNSNHYYVLSVTSIHAGDAFNIIPDELKLSGTVRTLYNEDRKFIYQMMEDSLIPYNNSGYRCTLEYIYGYDATFNHKDNVDKIISSAMDIVGKENINSDLEPQASEDFCYFTQNIPGALFFVGSGNKEKNIIEPLHSPKYEADEDSIFVGAAIMTNIILS